jgi:selenocysteine lyase/cysteine desulfurase
MWNNNNEHFPPIYLDYNATTPVDREVADSMWPFISRHFGNPSSSHAFGLIWSSQNYAVGIEYLRYYAQVENCFVSFWVLIDVK